MTSSFVPLLDEEHKDSATSISVLDWGDKTQLIKSWKHEDRGLVPRNYVEIIGHGSGETIQLAKGLQGSR